MVHTQFLAKEGFRGLFVGIGLFVFAFLFDFKILLFCTLLFLVMWIFIFRNPERFPVERMEKVVLSPSDGRIVNIEYKNQLVLIDIVIDWVDVGLLRAPYDTKKVSFNVINGLKSTFSADDIKEKVNKKMYYSSENFDIIIEPQFFDASFYPLSSVMKADRIGFCKLGKLQVIFKENFLDLKVNVGDVLKGGETLLGYAR